jgi:hypothetical protein
VRGLHGPASEPTPEGGTVLGTTEQGLATMLPKLLLTLIAVGVVVLIAAFVVAAFLL